MSHAQLIFHANLSHAYALNMEPETRRSSLQSHWCHAHYIALASSNWPCTCRRRGSSFMHFISCCSFAHAQRRWRPSLQHHLGGLVLPLSCCSRAVITVTASCTIISRVIGWLEPVCAAIIWPNSLIASFMSLTRNLLQRTHTVSQRRGPSAAHTPSFWMLSTQLAHNNTRISKKNP